MPAEKPASPTACQASATCCTAAPTNTIGDNPAQAAARQALSQKLFEAGTATPAQADVTTKAEASKPKLGKDELPPIPAPASPLPATKEAKLEALLIQYKADLISPAEYHKQRAAILAQP